MTRQKTSESAFLCSSFVCWVESLLVQTNQSKTIEMVHTGGTGEAGTGTGEAGTGTDVPCWSCWCTAVWPVLTESCEEWTVISASHTHTHSVSWCEVYRSQVSTIRTGFLEPAEEGFNTQHLSWSDSKRAVRNDLRSLINEADDFWSKHTGAYVSHDAPLSLDFQPTYRNV